MNKIKLSDKTEMAVNFVQNQQNERLVVSFAWTGDAPADILSKCTETALETIEYYVDDTLQNTYRNWTGVGDMTVQKNYAYELILTKTDLKPQLDAVRATVDYVAMMANVDIPEVQ